MPDVSINVTAKVDKASSQSGEVRTTSGNGASRPALDACYGRIGISAAAARYQGSAKNPAYAPTSTHWRDQYAGDTA